jgi:hypothetical protein
LKEPWKQLAAYPGSEGLLGAERWEGYAIGHQQDAWPWEELTTGEEGLAWETNWRVDHQGDHQEVQVGSSEEVQWEVQWEAQTVG